MTKIVFPKYTSEQYRVYKKLILQLPLTKLDNEVIKNDIDSAEGDKDLYAKKKYPGWKPQSN